jgi:hypothetical protein
MAKKKSTLRRMGDAVADAASSVGKALGLTGGKKKSSGKKASAKKKPAAKAGAKKTGAKKSAAKKK